MTNISNHVLNYGLTFYSMGIGAAAFISLALILAGYNVYENRYKVLAFFVISGTYCTLLFYLAFLSYLPQLLRPIIMILLDIVCIILLFRPPRIFFVIFLYEFITMVSTSAASMAWHYGLGISTADYMSLTLIKILFPLSYSIPLAILAYISYRKNWCILKGTSNLRIPITTLPPAIQIILLAITINELFFSFRFDPATRGAEAAIFFILIISLVISSFFVLRILRSAEQEAVTVAQETLAMEMRKQIETIRKQRHDFINHVQMMQALLIDNRLKELSFLVETINKETS